MSPGHFWVSEKETLPTAIPKSCDAEFVLISHIVGPESPSGQLPGSFWHLPFPECVGHERGG